MIKQYAPEYHSRLGELFLAVCDLDPEDQTTHLELVCERDPALRATVEALLEQDRKVEGFLRSRKPLIAGAAPPLAVTKLTGAGKGDARTVVQSPDALPTIEGYEIREVLGHGGMGIVCRAVQLDLNREVALKILPALVGAADPAVVERFKREAAAAARLHHKNIVPIYDFGQSDAGYYYSMEWIRGVSLDIVIRSLRGQGELPEETDESASKDRAESKSDGGMSLEFLPRPFERGYFQSVATWMIDACNALSAAEREGVVHRDIKPANLLLSEHGSIMVTDFGLARTEHEDTMTAANTLMGTLRYMSPEQLLGQRVPIDHRADIYSLGATLFELLTLQPLFEGQSSEKLIASIIAQEPPRAASLNPKVPRDLDTICTKMLEKLLDRRYASAEGVAADLRAFIEGRTISAKPASPLRQVTRFARRHVRWLVSLVAFGSISALAWVQLAGMAKRRLDARVSELIGQGLVSQQNREWRIAADIFGGALQLDPNDARTLGNLAIVLKELYNEHTIGDISLLVEAKGYCDRALAIDPGNSGIWNVKGVLLKKLGDFSGARAAYQTALALPSDQPEFQIAALNNLAEVQWLQGDPASAESTLHSSVELAERTQTPAWYTWCDLASLQLSQQNPAAIESIRRAFSLKAEPGWRLHLIRARIHLQLEGSEDPDQALHDAFAAKERSRPDGRVQRIVALAKLRAGQYNEAIESADEAIALGDDFAFSTLIAGIAEGRLGRLDACFERMEAVRQNWPDELISNGYAVSADRAMLWFDTADQLLELWQEGENLIHDAP